MGEISVVLVFFAGVISFLSPCVLPMVPGYIGFISGDLEADSKVSRTFVLKRAAFFVLGFGLVFLLMGASVGLVSRFFMRYRLWLRRISGLLIILFGLKTMGLLRIPFLDGGMSRKGPEAVTRHLDALLLGMAFATGWTPCVGPVLASVLMFAATSGQPLEAALLLLIYTLGMGLPFMLTAFTFKTFHQVLHRYERVFFWIFKVGGLFLVILGVAVFLDRMTFFNQFFDFIRLPL